MRAIWMMEMAVIFFVLLLGTPSATRLSVRGQNQVVAHPNMLVQHKSAETQTTNGDTSDRTEIASKKGHSARGYESTDDSFEKAAGDSGKDEHTVETAESGEKDTVFNDGGHEESVYEDDESGMSASRSVNAKKEARRSFEKGFYHQYHKKESHQLHKFFGNEHKGGEYHKYGMQNSRHKSDSSKNSSGKTRSSSASGGKDANTKIRQKDK